MNPKKAMKHWPTAEWILGDGNIALLAHCGVLTVTLWMDEAAAKNQKKFIDRYGCGGQCRGASGHEIKRLGTSTK
jgi:hypothetical protein